MKIIYVLYQFFIALIFYLGTNAQPYQPPPDPYKYSQKPDKDVLLYKGIPLKKINTSLEPMYRGNPFSLLMPEQLSWKPHIPPLPNTFPTRYSDRQKHFIPQSLNHPKRLLKTHSNKSPLGVREDWVHIYESGFLASTDILADMVTDSLGNIYVTGTTTHLPYGLDICTIKYDVNGNETWRVYFDAGYQGYDEAWKIELDQEGNVVVTGRSMTGTGWGDIMIIKYNSEGILQWNTQYEGNIASYEPFELAIDFAGNIILCGMVYPDDDSVTDYIILKYNAHGELLWTAQYGERGIWDEPTDLKSDQLSNIYVTGRSHDSWSPTDYYITNTLKYNSEGELLWEEKVSSGDHGWQSCHPKLAINDSGYVYLITTIGGGNRGNMLTIKYNQSGQMIWWKDYHVADDQAAKMLTLDLWGNIYVGGMVYHSANTLLENVILKYDRHGNLQWDNIQPYGMNGLICNNNGSIYYISKGKSLVKLHSDGWREWQKITGDSLEIYNPILLAISPDNHAYICGTRQTQETEQDYLTQNFDDQGQRLWSVHFNGDKNERGYPESIYMDNYGKILVTGMSYVSGSDQNLVTLTYNKSGELLRQLRYEGDFSRHSGVHCKMVGSGELITATRVQSSDDYSIIRTDRYGIDGRKIWEQYFGTGGRHSVSHFETDNFGNIYVSGQQYTDSSRYFSVKYSASGQQQWVIWHSKKDNYWIAAYHGFFVDETGNVYMVNRTSSSIIITKYSTDSQLAWEKEIQQSNQYFSLNFLVDPFENCYLAGYSYDDNILFTIKLNKNGQIEWTSMDDVPGGRPYGIYVNDITVDISGNIYITGDSYTDFLLDIFTLKYNKYGELLWKKSFRGDYSDRGLFVLVDRKKNVYIIGLSVTAPMKEDIIVIKYDSAGNERWMMQYGGSNIMSRDFPRAAMLDPYGNIFIAATSDLGSGWYTRYITTIKFAQTDADISLLPENLSILPNIPNPFNNQTMIRYQLPQAGQVTLKIYDVLGQEVAEKDLGYQNIGDQVYHYTANQMASGVYYYQVQVGDFSKTAKMVLLK